MTKLLLSGLVDLPRVSFLLSAFEAAELGSHLHLGASHHHPAPSPTTRYAFQDELACQDPTHERRCHGVP